MKAGTKIETERLILRHWTIDDLDAFHRLNSDETIMHFFPFRRNRQQCVEKLEQLAETVANGGMTWCAVALKSHGEVIGFSGLAEVDFDTPFTPAVEIGWRFLPEHWGNGYATEAAEALLTHGFGDLGLARIVAFAVVANTASSAVMQRIGMRPRPDLEFDMPGINDDFAHLRRHVLYTITRDEWRSGSPDR